jgi:hypothetical protein
MSYIIANLKDKPAVIKPGSYCCHFVNIEVTPDDTIFTLQVEWHHTHKPGDCLIQAIIREEN